MSNEPKLCKDCKHASPEIDARKDSRLFFEFAACHHDKGRSVNLVNGESYLHNCSSMRCDEDFCGHEGVFFELKTAQIVKPTV